MSGKITISNTAENVAVIDIEGIIGVPENHIRVLVPLKKNYEEMKQVIREEIEHNGVSVIIPRRECVQTLKRKKK